MTQYGFISQDEPQYSSFKLQNESLMQIMGEIEVGKEVFNINEETGDREVMVNGTYSTDLLIFEVVDGKITTLKERFNEIKTVDGVVLKVDGDVAVGNAVMVVTEEGEVPAPDGNYELEGDVKIKIEGGVITAVGDEEPEVEETPETETETEPAPEDGMSEIFEMLKSFIQSVTEKMNAMSVEMSATKEKLNEVTNEFNEFRKLPAGTKIPNGKVEITIENEDSKVNRILQFRNKK